MDTPEDRFYNPARINGWFAVAAILVFVTSGAVILADHYDREWKTYQDAFFTMEKANARETVALKTAAPESLPAGAWDVADALLYADAQPNDDQVPTLEDAGFKAVLDARWSDPDFAAGAALAARLYETAAEKARADETMKAARDELLAKRTEAENARFKAEKEQRELQALVDELKYEKDHAVQHGETEKASVLEKEWRETEAREQEVHSRMDAHSGEKQGANDALKALVAVPAGWDARAQLLYEAAGIAGAERKLDSFVAEALRNAPVIDFPAPTLQIRQKVFPELKEDYNFAQIGRVDRCMTCHMGIDKIRVDPATGEVIPLYTAENTPEKVFRTHSRPELFVSSVSKHSVDRVGCTVCHGGLGWGLSFSDAYHTPDSPEQEKEWKEKHHWHRGESWTSPMLPMKYVEAGCAKCHRDPVGLDPGQKFAKEIPGAPKWNEGMRLFEDSGCFGCHKMDGFTVRGLDQWVEKIADPHERASLLALSVRKAGPSLERVASKWPSKEAAFKWIREPRSLREHATMPQFFAQPNNDGIDEMTKEDYRQRSRAEVWGIVEYLWANSGAFEPEKPPAGVNGDAARGKALFGGPENVGCVACHSTVDFLLPSDGGDGAPTRGNDFGPDLSTLGSKTTGAWIYSWVRDPAHYWPGSRMPDLRLTEQEAADVAAYLVSLRAPDWESRTEEPAGDGMIGLLAEEAARVLVKGKGAADWVAGASREERLALVGQRAIARYACYGCHDIKGFEGAERIGTDLGGNQGWGSKDVDRLDFGMLENAEVAERYAKDWGTEHLPHRKPEWARMKLLNPRVFDAGLTKKPQEKLVMPNFHFTGDQADALVTFLLSAQKEEIPTSLRDLPDAREQEAEKMKWIVRQYNCYGCHTIDRETVVRGDGTWTDVPRGRDIAPWIGMDEEARKMWPPTLGGEVDLSAPHHPPDVGEGAKVHPDWLHRFLRTPGDMVVRHWLKVRMPGFPFTQQELNALTAGFAAKDGVPYPIDESRPEPLEGEDLEEIRRLFLDYQCTKCHVLAGSPPPSGLGTDLALAWGRLRFDWVRTWLRNPPGLQPSSSMPENWPIGDDGEPRAQLKHFGGDPHLQIRRMAEFVLQLGRPKDGGAGSDE